MDVIEQIIKGIVEGIPEILQLLSLLNLELQALVLSAIQNRALQGDLLAMQALQKLQNPKVAKLGTKLNYINKLKGKCPDGQELAYIQKGGKMISICKPCMLKKGGKLKKKC